MTDRTGSTDRAPETALDLNHLSRMTHGDRQLEREVLELFDRQAATMADRLRGAGAELAVSCAHTLKGSARGIGAWRLARAAEQVERAAAAGVPDVAPAMAQLLSAVDEARSAIARRLVS
jgi:HPt (histidine-containing phosphotransfer) domain-containing protein